MCGRDGVSLAAAQAEEVEFLRRSSTALQGMGTLRKAPSSVQRGDSLMGPLLLHVPSLGPGRRGPMRESPL